MYRNATRKLKGYLPCKNGGKSCINSSEGKFDLLLYTGFIYTVQVEFFFFYLSVTRISAMIQCTLNNGGEENDMEFYFTFNITLVIWR